MEMSNRVLNIYSLFNNLMQINGTSGIYSADSLYSLITNNATSEYSFDVYKLPNYRKIHSVITNNSLANARYFNG